MASARMSDPRRSFPLILVALGLTALIGPAAAADLEVGYQPAAYAIQGARVIPDGREAIDPGTVVVRGDLIEAIGPADRVTIPFDAEIIDGRGLVVYPGFLDLYTTLGVPEGTARSQSGPAQPIPQAEVALPSTPLDNRNGLTPEFQVATVLDLPDGVVEQRRKLGFTDLLVAPGGGIATGQSALVSLNGLPRREAIVRSPVALHIALRRPEHHRSRDQREQSEAIDGTSEHDHDGEATDSNGPRQVAVYPVSLMGVVAHLRQAMLDAEYDHQRRAEFARVGGTPPPYDPALETLQAARTGGLAVWWEADSRDEIERVLGLAREFGTGCVIVGGREAAQVAYRLKAENISVVLRLDFPSEPRVPDPAEYQKRPPEDRSEPFRVLVHRAEQWRERIQTAKALAEAGVRFGFCSDGLANPEDFPDRVRTLIAAGLPPAAAIEALTRSAAEIVGLGRRLGTLEAGKLAHLVVMTAPINEPSARVRYVLVNGLKFDVDRPTPTQRSDTAPRPSEEAKPDAPAPPEVMTEEDQPPATPFEDIATELDEDRRPLLQTGGNVLIRNATILTGTGATLPRGSILVRGGKIVAIGPDLAAPAGVKTLDAAGLVAMPGIIDTHSHIAIQGGVNESSLAITPEVRVRDALRGDDPAIYRALAGGVTTARLLHGSANPIGGQDVVIKLRYGRPARELIVEGRPQGIKFALGENVIRRPGRFPSTRMGVESVLDRAFVAARADRAAWNAYRAAQARGKAGLPPRRDLRLEALAGLLDGSMQIHCHSYRSDEILMLLRLAERHNIQVRSLQHALEGYKVASEIATHGASVSTFADWFAYKFEARDAIPFNAALLTQAGVSVSIKSDDEELIRHLYLEAAKMVKYGGATEAQALAMITRNPAREIGLEGRLGSIEVGKDADLALFNAHPFDSFARCELTLIDGEVYFQRHESDGGFAPRPGDHAAMPAPSPEAQSRTLEIVPNSRGLYALTGATLHPVSGPDIKNGTIVVADGRISALGGPKTPLPEGAIVVDAAGLDVWPGLVDAGSLVGVFEIGSLAETQDFSDSAQYQPELRTGAAIHPDSELIPVTRANGVLTAYVQPTGGTISGQGCVINLDGWVPAEMMVLDRAALNVNIPSTTPTAADISRERALESLREQGRGGRPDPDRLRRERIEALKQQFRLALRYDTVQSEARARREPGPEPDPRLEALVPYARGERPVIFRADRRGDILAALRIAEELKLKAIISGGLEAWKVADLLRAARVPVLIGGTLRLPAEVSDPYDAPFTNPARLYEAGIPFAIRSGGHGPDQATSGRNLPYEAAVAVAFGLPEAEALRAVTLSPAQILGVADQVGSLEVGKRANLVLTVGSILQPTSVVKGLFLNGKPLSPESRHTQLYALYLRRLAEVRAGVSPLGLDRDILPIPPPILAPGPTPGSPTPPTSRAVPANLPASSTSRM